MALYSLDYSGVLAGGLILGRIHFSLYIHLIKKHLGIVKD